MRTKSGPLDSENLSGNHASAANVAAKLWRAGNGLTHNATAAKSGDADPLESEFANNMISLDFSKAGSSPEAGTVSSSPVAKQMILQQCPEDALDWGSLFGWGPKHKGSGDRVSSSLKSNTIREYPVSTMEAAT